MSESLELLAIKEKLDKALEALARIDGRLTGIDAALAALSAPTIYNRGGR